MGTRSCIERAIDDRSLYEEIAFEAIGEGLARLKANEVTGRLVARFGD